MCYMNCTSKRFDLFLKVNGKYQLICQERRKLEPTLIKMSESCRSVLCKYTLTKKDSLEVYFKYTTSILRQ